jgi:hypothetical protein
MPFEYSNDDLDALDLSLSKDRLDRYLRLGNGDRKKAIQFYEMNNIVSESLFGVIRGFEVALRNAYHRVLSAAAHDRADWYSHFRTEFNREEQDSITKAEEKIASRKLAVVPGRVVAMLGLGFWCGLTSRPYDAQLWVPHLHKAFPCRRLGRKEAWERFDNIRQIRNRVAHHESILHLDIAKEHKEIIESIGWICAKTQSWVLHTSTLDQKLLDLRELVVSTVKPKT